MVSIRVALSLLVAAASALPGMDISKEHDWQPPKDSDSRSPCPMLNTMANHGYLPRHGRGVSVADIGLALKRGINFNVKDGEGAAQMFYTKLNNATRLDLEDLNAHNLTEHDASLTRADFREPGADSLHVNYLRLNDMLLDAGTDKYLSPASLAKSRARVEQIQPIPQDFANQVLGEAGFLLQTMSEEELPQGLDADYSGVRAPKERVAAWMALERLPYEFGWHKPCKEFKTAQTGGLARAVGAELAALAGSA